MRSVRELFGTRKPRSEVTAVGSDSDCPDRARGLSRRSHWTARSLTLQRRSVNPIAGTTSGGREMRLSVTFVAACVAVVLLLVGVVSASQATGDQLAQAGSVRGAAPGPCTGNWSSTPCSEQGLNHCWQYDGDETNCTKDNRTCPGGCSAAKNSDVCAGGRPWNALCDPNQNSEVADGCGQYFTENTAKCQYANGKCRCTGTVGTSDCKQKTAVRTDTTAAPCTVVAAIE